MERYCVKKSSLSGTISVPPSKSHTLRAVLFASLANGKSTITRYLSSPDTMKMIEACRLLGALIEWDEKHIAITGINGSPKAPIKAIDCGNSGQVLRFIGAMAALTPSKTVFTGDESIQKRRPIGPLIEALTQLGARCRHTYPIEIQGPIHPGSAILDGSDSQPVSALLMALSFLKGRSEITVINPGEKPWVALTLSWLNRFGIQVDHKRFEHYVIHGNASFQGFRYSSPGDFSSGAFPIVAALITGSEIVVENLDIKDSQGDKAIIPLLQEMGAKMEIKESAIVVKRGGELKGRTIDVNDMIDAVPILAVLGCFASGKTRITGAKIARNKESDRLFAMATELKKMGAKIQLFDDGLLIEQSQLKGTEVESYGDHRVAMALSVAGLGAKQTTTVNNIQCVDKSYPDFYQQLQYLMERK